MFPGVIALDSVDIAFELGEIHAIIGENGAGKSTLIKCLTGVYEPEEGEILIGGKNAMKNRNILYKYIKNKSYKLINLQQQTYIYWK